MKTRVLVLAAGVAFVTAILCVPGGSMGRPPASDNKVPEIMWEPDRSQWDDTSIFGVMKVIGDIQKQLDAINETDTSNGMSDDVIEKVAKLHGKYGRMAGRDGSMHAGPDGIKAHLQQMKNDAKKFHIQLKFVYAKEFTDVYKNGIGGKKDDQQVIHNLIFIFSNSYEINGKPVDPPSTATCMHVRVCDCVNY